MMDERDILLKEAERGQRANDLLDNALFIESFSLVESNIIQKWRDCRITDKDSQHELKVMLHLLSEVKRHIETVAETGKLANERLSMIDRLKDKIRKFAA